MGMEKLAAMYLDIGSRVKPGDLDALRDQLKSVSPPAGSSGSAAPDLGAFAQQQQKETQSRHEQFLRASLGLAKGGEVPPGSFVLRKEAVKTLGGPDLVANRLRGSIVPGSGNTDSVPVGIAGGGFAKMMPGEVIAPPGYSKAMMESLNQADRYGIGGKVKDAAAYAKAKTVALYKWMEARYGRAAAVSMFAAGHVAGLATPLAVIPGSTLIGTAATVPIAELIRQAGRGVKGGIGALKSLSGYAEGGELDAHFKKFNRLRDKRPLHKFFQSLESSLTPDMLSANPHFAKNYQEWQQTTSAPFYADQKFREPSPPDAIPMGSRGTPFPEAGGGGDFGFDIFGAQTPKTRLGGGAGKTMLDPDEQAFQMLQSMPDRARQTTLATAGKTKLAPAPGGSPTPTAALTPATGFPTLTGQQNTAPGPRGGFPTLTSQEGAGPFADAMKKILDSLRDQNEFKREGRAYQQSALGAAGMQEAALGKIQGSVLDKQSLNAGGIAELAAMRSPAGQKAGQQKEQADAVGVMVAKQKELLAAEQKLAFLRSSEGKKYLKDLADTNKLIEDTQKKIDKTSGKKNEAGGGGGLGDATGRLGMAGAVLGGSILGAVGAASPNAVLSTFTGSIQQLSAVIGISFVDVITDISYKIQQFSNWIENLDDKQKTTIATWIGWGAAGLTLVGVLGKVTSTISMLTGSLRAFGAMSGPVGLLMAVAGVGAAGMAASRATHANAEAEANGEEGQNFGAFAPVVSKLAETFDKVTAVLAPVIENLITKLAPVLENVITAIAPAASKIFEAVGNLVAQLAPPLANIVAALVPPLVNIVSALVPGITSLISILAPAIELATSILSPALELVAAVVKEAEPVFEFVGDVMKNVVVPALQLIATAIRAAIEALRAIVDKVKGTVSGSVSAGLVAQVMGQGGGWLSQMVNQAQGGQGGGWSGVAANAAKAAVEGAEKGSIKAGTSGKEHANRERRPLRTDIQFQSSFHAIEQQWRRLQQVGAGQSPHQAEMLRLNMAALDKLIKIANGIDEIAKKPQPPPLVGD